MRRRRHEIANSFNYSGRFGYRHFFTFEVNGLRPSQFNCAATPTAVSTKPSGILISSKFKLGGVFCMPLKRIIKREDNNKALEARNVAPCCLGSKCLNGASLTANLLQGLGTY